MARAYPNSSTAATKSVAAVVERRLVSNVPRCGGSGALPLPWREGLFDPQALTMTRCPLTRNSSCTRISTSPRMRLFDSHILKPQSGAELDALEVIQPPAHGFRSGLSVIAVPSAEP